MWILLHRPVGACQDDVTHFPAKIKFWRETLWDLKINNPRVWTTTFGDLKEITPYKVSYRLLKDSQLFIE